MPAMRLDHFITYTSAENIDDYLLEYSALGFLPMDRTVRHDPGLRNGFIGIGPEYLEFCWVEDEGLFSEGSAEEAEYRASGRPFAIGIVSDDVHAVHDEWTTRGFAVPAVWSKAARDDEPDAPPLWSFQEIPSELLPGVVCFVLTYHSRAKGSIREVSVAPNSIYAIAGITFVAVDPKARAKDWQVLLSPDEQILRQEESYELMIGPHFARWITPRRYETATGSDWVPASHSHGELAVIHLLAKDLDKTQQMVAQAGNRTSQFTVDLDGQRILLVEADSRDGFVFEVREREIQDWLTERKKRFAENIKVNESDS